MTVVAYRDGIMCADSRTTQGNTIIGTTTKIHRLDSGALFGVAGDEESRELHRLVNKVKTSNKLPSSKELKELGQTYTALLVFPSGEGWRFDIGRNDEDGEYGSVTRLGVYAAVGSGANFALGALDIGASAYAA